MVFGFSLFCMREMLFMAGTAAMLVLFVVRAWAIDPEATKLGLRIVGRLIKRKS